MIGHALPDQCMCRYLELHEGDDEDDDDAVLDEFGFPPLYESQVRTRRRLGVGPGRVRTRRLGAAGRVRFKPGSDPTGERPRNQSPV